jgi:hypothetical protein
MKKLKLKALELGAKEVLSRDQLKNVLGGSGSGGSGGSGGNNLPSCTASCSGGTSVTCYGHPGGSGCSATDNLGCVGHDNFNTQYFIKC